MEAVAVGREAAAGGACGSSADVGGVGGAAAASKHVVIVVAIDGAVADAVVDIGGEVGAHES